MSIIFTKTGESEMKFCKTIRILGAFAAATATVNADVMPLTAE